MPLVEQAACIKQAGRFERWNGRPGLSATIGTHDQRAGWLQPVPRSRLTGASMKEADVEVVLQRAREQFPVSRPRIITENGLQFIAKNFKEFIRLRRMTLLKTSPLFFR